MRPPKSRSDRLRSIQALSSREAQDLAAQMTRQAKVLQDAEARLIELQEHLASYVDDHARARLDGISAMRLSESHVFVERLKLAVTLQQRTVEQARSRFEACRARWIAQHIRTNALGSAVHRLEHQEILAQARLDERTLDELAARAHQKPEQGSGSSGGSD